jgi:hypothetical protein
MRSPLATILCFAAVAAAVKDAPLWAVLALLGVAFALEALAAPSGGGPPTA